MMLLRNKKSRLTNPVKLFLLLLLTGILTALTFVLAGKFLNSNAKKSVPSQPKVSMCGAVTEPVPQKNNILGMVLLQYKRSYE
jgi:hypothetical protein